MVAVREQKEMVDAGLDVGGVRYERIEPLKTWRLTADVDAKAHDLAAGTSNSRDAHIAMDLTFEALIPAVGVDGQGARRAARARRRARASARVISNRPAAGRVGSRPTAFATSSSARGNRDKSWGPRRWGGPKMWRWFSINIDDDTHFGGIRIGTDAGDLHRGWVWTDGEHSSIREWKVTSELADDGVTHTATHVHATDKHGRVHELDADVFRVSPGPRASGPTPRSSTRASPAGPTKAGPATASASTCTSSTPRPGPSSRSSSSPYRASGPSRGSAGASMTWW